MQKERIKVKEKKGKGKREKAMKDEWRKKKVGMKSRGKKGEEGR